MDAVAQQNWEEYTRYKTKMFRYTSTDASPWVAIDGTRVVNKWRETLPGDPPEGATYHYDGISELRYAGSQHWDYMFGLPDVIGLQQVYSRWKADGQHEIHGEVYPGM